MDVKALLAMDMTTLGRLLRRGWEAWTAELMAALPARFRHASGPVIAALKDGGLVYRRQGRPAAPTATALAAVPAEAVLIGEFDYPVLAPDDLRQALALDLDRLTPFRAEEVAFDVEILAGPERRGGIGRIALGLVRRRDLDGLAAAFAARGCQPSGFVLVEEGSGQVRFAFGGSVARPAPSSRLLPWLRLAVGLFLLLDLALVVERDRQSLAELRAAVEAERPLVERARNLRAKIEAEEARRRAFGAGGAAATLALLDEVTRLLPDGAYLERLSVDGGRLHLAGRAQDPGGLPALLAQSHLWRGLSPAPAGPGQFAFDASLGAPP
ncbi:PilN domain-containing protein [Zavarzinia sp.]|uniref:PilN domain-containing protein n=1 Tax=Zavarzinia sp. TaxID=2027920 RepID=UPI00356B291E